MRALYFRAYNTKKKEWLFPYPEPFSIIGETTIFDCLRQQSMTETDGFNDIEITQFTGLKDKNGKMIFEGDRVKYWDSYKVWIETEVEFYGGAWVIMAHEKDGTEIQLNEFELQDMQGIEIIGNIYEPPKED